MRVCGVSCVVLHCFASCVSIDTRFNVSIPVSSSVSAMQQPRPSPYEWAWEALQHDSVHFVEIPPDYDDSDTSGGDDHYTSQVSG